MGDEEIALKAFVHAAHQVAAGDCRRIRGHDAARFPHLVDQAIDFVLDLKFLDHRLDDPVSVRQKIEIVLDIAAGNALGVFLVHERGGLSL